MRLVSVSERPYAVVGASARDLERAIDALGPARAGRRFAAYTDWSIVWRWSDACGDGGEARVAAVVVEARAVITLPRWQPLRGTPDALLERWASWLAALREHEHGHVEIAERARAAVFEVLRSLAPSPDRESLCAAIERASSDVLARARQEDRDYDRATRDGATQGAAIAALIDA